MQAKIGLIGLGAMGSRMGQNILSAGFELTVYDIREEPIRRLMRAGANGARSPKEVAKVSDIIMLSLPNPSVSEEVVSSENGVLAGAGKGTVLIELSTIPPSLARKMAEAAKRKGVAFLDCPVSGGPEGAATGTLNLFVGGETKDLERCRPLLESIGERIYHLGGVGAGETVKLINNLMVHCIRAATLEAMVLAVKAGIDLKTLLKVINASSGQSWMMNNMLPKIASKRKTEVPILNAYAVVKSIVDLGQELNVPLPVTEEVMRLYAYYIAEGLADKDLTDIVAYLENALDAKITF